MLQMITAVMIVLALVGAEPAGAATAFEREVVTLEQTLAENDGHAGLRAAKRRVFKNVARRAQALLGEAPDETNRFRLLGLIFQSQKRLLAVENTEENRQAIFRTSEMLLQAPDAYAELRLEADLLLSEKKLSEADATLQVRAEALAELIDRYQDTPAEARSLMAAAVIVRKLADPELEREIERRMIAGFPDDPDMIQFRRGTAQFGSLRVVFRGSFARPDGSRMHFPGDVVGHMCVLVFWSQDNPEILARLQATQAELAPYAEQFRVFSFNVDDLPDGGASILREQGLDWTVLLLPGGQNSETYRTYLDTDLPQALYVNEYGIAYLHSSARSRSPAPDDAPAPIWRNRYPSDDTRYLAHIQSILIGDFLIRYQEQADAARNGGGASGVPAPLQACFPPHPFRYRLPRQAMLENYTEAARSGAELLTQDAAAPHAWQIANYRMIALLGMQSFTGDPAYLDEAGQAAASALAREHPPAADLVPRFVLARAALREEGADTVAILEAFIDSSGGSNAPPMAVAAASILALHARELDLHDAYRRRFLEMSDDAPAYATITAFLRNRYIRLQILNANTGRDRRRTRLYIRNSNGDSIIKRLPPFTLQRLDGSTIPFPRASGKLTGLLFVEPPADPANNKLGYPFIREANQLAALLDGRLDVVIAFLTDNAERVRAMLAENDWQGDVAMLPGGITNPVVEQLGIFSADRVINVFVLRRDGTVAWRESGYVYPGRHGGAIQSAMRIHAERLLAEDGEASRE